MELIDDGAHSRPVYLLLSLSCPPYCGPARPAHGWPISEPVICHARGASGQGSEAKQGLVAVAKLRAEAGWAASLTARMLNLQQPTKVVFSLLLFSPGRANDHLE